MKTKKEDTEPLKLIRWANDNYPPIDFANELQSVLSLIEEVKKLRKEIAELKKNENL